MAHMTATIHDDPSRHNLVNSNGTAVLHYCSVFFLHEAGCRRHFFFSANQQPTQVAELLMHAQEYVQCLIHVLWVFAVFSLA